ncbi:MAG: amidohydrolase family protein [Vallitaleaceae bacterium]|nr:amidohydrolase family protein [Vallitaleaceae bacterium]
MYDLGIIGGEAYINGQFTKVNLYIQDGKISKIDCALNKCLKTYDVSGKKVLPGIIDPHVHFDLRGNNFVSSDDFRSGSISAAYGGITTILDFLDPICQGSALEKALIARKECAKECVIDYGFHVTIKNPKLEVEAIVSEMKRLGLHRVKLFTTYSDSGRRTYDAEIRELLTYGAKEDLLVLAHIEADDQIRMEDTYKPSDLVKSRPASSETDEALKLAEMVKETGGKLYMVHCSSGQTVKNLVESFKDIINKRFFIESCPHYFVFNEAIVQGEKGGLFTMAPPLRNKADQDQLVEQIDDVMTIGTDHCPFMKAEKQRDFLKEIPMGIGGVEHAFSIMYELFGEKIIDKMTLNPAKIHGLYPRKGIIQVGSDADIVIFEEKQRTITNDHSRCDYTVYEGFEVHTKVVSTLVRGEFVVKEGCFLGGCGEYIKG